MHDLIVDEKYRHIDNKYLKMCMLMKKTWHAQKYIAGIWMISLPYSKICLVVYNFSKEILF